MTPQALLFLPHHRWQNPACAPRAGGILTTSSGTPSLSASVVSPPLPLLTSPLPPPRLHNIIQCRLNARESRGGPPSWLGSFGSIIHGAGACPRTETSPLKPLKCSVGSERPVLRSLGGVGSGIRSAPTSVGAPAGRPERQLSSRASGASRLEAGTQDRIPFRCRSTQIRHYIGRDRISDPSIRLSIF